MLWLAFMAFANEPTDHTVLYYNARMALREGKKTEALKLWYLRNVLEDRTHKVSAYDVDFRSITWASLGEMGLCQDGLGKDDDGVGLWPIGVHNWITRNMRRRTVPKRPNAFKAFNVARQQRYVSIGDVLTMHELRTITFRRGRCSLPGDALNDAGQSFRRLSNRQVAARTLRYLLLESLFSLDGDRVEGMEVIDARLFDIGLQLTQLAAREARKKARRRALQGRQLGLSRASTDDLRDEAPAYSFAPDSEPAKVLRACLDWRGSQWMALSPDHRLFLYDHATAYGGDRSKLDRIALEILDQLVVQGEGKQVGDWVARLGEAPDPRIWAGARGEQLLTLDSESGFRQRSVIALHRGVDQLGKGELTASLRSMAYALQNAHESRSPERVQSLARRWLSYVSAQFELDQELLVMLQEMVPRLDYAIILEDLLWHAAFFADQPSFQLAVDGQRGRGALARRVRMLTPLAEGNLGLFLKNMRDGLQKSPSETMRFLNQMVDRLELEDADVRATHVATLDALIRFLRPLTPEAGNKGRRARGAATLVSRFQAIREGVAGLAPDATARDHARGNAPTSEVFAGSVRLAPTDPLPWPFPMRSVAAPSIFKPILIRPEEWRDPEGDRVFGWRITE